MATFEQKVYVNEYNVNVPKGSGDPFKEAVEKELESTDKPTTRDLKRQAKNRIGVSVTKATMRTTALQVASEYYMANRRHNINMVGLMEGNTYKQQSQQIAKKYEDIWINALRTGASGALISANPLVGLATGAVAIGGGYAGIGLEAMYAERTASVERTIDSVNVDLARRALSTGSIYGSRNIENKGVMY